ncbi:hypothetical protein Vretimale_3145 [Volvox reticuliferus]|uniref:Thioredoxin domain-containing protein n=1 Tax=Volvox reticuliferus TaxID=1737510 RepID=A0A8J4D854_9CHLO|nr:hypothetical protein Vretifemale_6637 [Volvox reticuliferus]GIL97619.1 hypothetical protein Vretimale_3145 [Volvox reticuliferus]
MVVSGLGLKCPSRNLSTPEAQAWVPGKAVCPRRRAVVHTTALHIDRRGALEAAWRRQEEAEARKQRLSTDIDEGRLITVPDTAGLDAVIEQAGSQLVVVFMYSRQCGVCKDAARRFEQLRNEAHRAKARVVFVQHDVETDYGDKSDLSRFYNVRAVPCFLFFDGGAVVRRLSLRDIRRLTGPKPYVQAALAEDVRRLRNTFMEVLLSRAPSARS